MPDRVLHDRLDKVLEDLKVEKNDNSLSKVEDHKKWFEKIYNDYFDRLFRYAFTITKNRETAEDVVSEVFLSLWDMRVAKKENIKELDAYLFVSVKNRAIRSITSDPFTFESIDFQRTLTRIDKLTPDQLVMEQELASRIDQAVSELPDQCKLVYELVKIKGMKYSEVASELGISEFTVKNHLIKALKKIRLVITDYFGDNARPLLSIV